LLVEKDLSASGENVEMAAPVAGFYTANPVAGKVFPSIPSLLPPPLQAWRACLQDCMGKDQYTYHSAYAYGSPSPYACVYEYVHFASQGLHRIYIHIRPYENARTEEEENRYANKKRLEFAKGLFDGKQ
jgi:hypothetical protein